MTVIRTQADVEGPPESLDQAWSSIRERIISQWGGWPNRLDSSEWRKSRRKLAAYVNDNRWVADCPDPSCNAGIMVAPGVQKAACFDCGTTYSLVEFPEMKTLKAATDVLSQRPLQNRNWNPEEESVKDLKVENLTHGYKI